MPALGFTPLWGDGHGLFDPSVAVSAGREAALIEVASVV
jgi:hypothetical protein